MSQILSNGKMETKKEIGSRIRIIRQRLKMSQARFAKQIAVSNTAVSSYELGDAFPSLPCLIRIAALGNITFDWLILGEEMKEIELAQDESNLIKAFRKAIPDDKLAILRMAENAAMVSTLTK